jgi:hypothetical protein
MFFDAELRDHLIAYLEDNPDQVFAITNSHSGDGRLTITGNYESDRGYGRANNFQYEIEYTRYGEISSINGEVPKVDTAPLIEAIKKAIKRNFKLKRKRKKLGEQ